MSKESSVQELSDDIEVVGPGQMLAQAREKLGMSQQQVADKLNFRTTLVKNIENEIFDQEMPATFNRGYLRNYAKLVDISVDEVLAGYETLNIAEKQCAELQSFSKGTEKQAESNRIMWVSYLILTLLIASSIVWWLQETKNNNEVSILTNQVETIITAPASNKPLVDNNPVVMDSSSLQVTSLENSIETEGPVKVLLAETLIDSPAIKKIVASKTAADVELKENDETGVDIDNEAIAETTVVEKTSDVQFVFSGDSWVNIFDATGERLAWGIKKSGYVMIITGQAPFKITLGKPELVAIEYKESAVDMTQFDPGNIAKFSLPLQ